MDRKKLAAIWTASYPADPDARESAVLTDMMAARRPATAEELLLVSGVGKHKLGKYGHEFLREIAAFSGGAPEGGQYPPVPET